MFTAGIDVGTVNMSISFVKKPVIITYIGSFREMIRYETDKEPTLIKTETKKMEGEYRALTDMMEEIAEFSLTSSTVIEMQTAMGRSTMQRIDGILYGFLIGRFPNMKVALSGSTIRKNFIGDRISGLNISAVQIPKGVKETKVPSFQFVVLLHKDFYEYVKKYTDKLDDIFDSIVYASVAEDKLQNGNRQRKKA